MEEANFLLSYRLGEKAMDFQDVITDLKCFGSLVYTSTFSGNVFVYDSQEERQVDSFALAIAAHGTASEPGWMGSAMQCSAFDLRNDILVAGSQGGSMGAWRASSHEPVAVWSAHADHVAKAQYVTDEDVYSVAHDGYFRAYNLAHGQTTHSFVACTNPLTSLAVETPDIVYVGGFDGTVKQLDLRAKACAAVLRPSATDDSPIRALSLGPAPPLAPANGTAPAAAATATSAGGRAPQLLYVSHGRGEVKVWDLRFPRVFTSGFAGATDAVRSFALAPPAQGQGQGLVGGALGGRLLGGCDDGSIRVWNAVTGASTDVLGGFNDGVTCLEVVNGLIFAGGYDGQLRVFSLAEIDEAAGRRRAEKEAQDRLIEEEAERARALAKALKKKKDAARKKKETEKSRYQRRL
jgi:WD40 repeat protein